MSMTKDQIIAEAMSLDAKDREEIAEELLISIGDADRAAIDARWLEEARKREEAFARGEITASGVDEAITRVQARARR